MKKKPPKIRKIPLRIRPSLKGKPGANRIVLTEEDVNPTRALNLKEMEDRNRERTRQRKYNKTLSSRDIGPMTQTINWERRLACKYDLKLFLETYMPDVFYLGWSDNHLRCIKRMEEIFLGTGKFALAMPRGEGKTAMCRGALEWGMSYAHRTYAFFVGSSKPKAESTLEFIKAYWYSSPGMLQDFPEICHPINKLQNRWHLAAGQLYNGISTQATWGTGEIRLPSLILSEEDVEYYMKHDPSSLRQTKYMSEDGVLDVYICKSAGSIINTAGIDGSIRGDAKVHPITLEQMRPDVALLDDVQRDVKAESPAACERTIRLIEGAVQGLAGPDSSISVLMPCTVSMEGDVADTFLDPTKKPSYHGERCKMVMQWPPGISDYEISNDTEAGRLWNAYADIRRTSLQRNKNISLATQFYEEHREAMDDGFIVSWKDRYDKLVCISAQQNAMELRLESPQSFRAEYQNIGKRLYDQSEILITAKQLSSKIIDLERGQVPVNAEHVVGFIDVQNEILFYGVLAVSPEFDGAFIDYGTWPEVPQRYFDKSQVDTWGLLTTEFFKAYPHLKDKAIRNDRGRVRAPLEAKIYHALGKLVPILMGREYIREDKHKKKFRIQYLGIDTRWGQANEAIKRYIRESRIRELIPYYGTSLPPTHRQFEEYSIQPGFFFENMKHPTVRDPKWVIRPNQDGMYYMSCDVDRQKDFLFQRFGSPPGSPGCISLFHAPAEDHDMFAHEVCSSEYPEPITARGLTKNKWTVRDGTAYDNDYLDVATACMALASFAGACLKTTDNPVVPTKRSLSDSYEKKRGVTGTPPSSIYSIPPTPPSPIIR